MLRKSPMFLVMLALAACGDDGDGGDETPAETGFTDQAIVVDYVDNVILPTYARLHDRADALDAAVQALATTRDAGTLTAAQEAWVAARVPWEQSEAFLFGPVDSFGYDPALDTWPLDNGQLDAVLAGGDTLTAEFVEGLGESQKGFHTIEYLLFGATGDKTPDQLTDREIEYLKATTDEFQRIAGELAASWTETRDGRAPYAQVFKTAGEAGNTEYPSLQAAGQQIVEGMIGILDEVANGKIAAPFDEADPQLVESQYSFNSLDDFGNNIRGVKRAYLGLGPDETIATGKSLSDFVKAQDAALDARVKAEIDAGIAAIGEIPDPFRDAIADPAAAPRIVAAQEALRKAQATLEGDVKALILQ